MKKAISIIAGLLLLPSMTLAVSLSDVSSNAYKTDIERLIDDGIVGGYNDGTYRPNNLINRAEFLKIVIGSNIERITPSYDGNKCFNDVDTSQWYADSVCTGKEIGVVGGYQDGTFKPANNISYAEALSIIFKMFELTYDSVDGDWTAPYLYHSQENNLAFGNSFDPHRLITRGEMARIITSFMDFKPNGRLIYMNDDLVDTNDKTLFVSEDDYENYQEDILELVNAERAKVGVIALKLDTKLNAAALVHAEDMQENNYFDHTSLNGDTAQRRARAQGYNKSVGENIGWNYHSPEEAMEGWMNSVGHRNNILSNIYLDLGVGRACDSNGVNCYWVQVFGTDWDAE